MENQKINKIFISWKEIEEQCKKISDTIKLENFNYDLIVSIGRGGMIPSRLIAEKLDIHNIEIFNCHSYTGINNQGRMISSPFNYDVLSSKKVLIVDDVYTTGNTIDFVCGRICQTIDEIFITTATLYTNQMQLDLERGPDLYATTYNAQNDWLVFPWEQDEEKS